MNIQIYYLSGTGNSLYVAKELGRRLGGADLVPVISVLKNEKITTAAETVGFVFPIHNLTSPIPLKRFLQRVDLSSAKYIFAIATRECSNKVFLDIDRMLAAQGKSLDAYFSVEMPCTYIPIFPIPPQNTIEKMNSELQKRLDKIQTIVAGRQVSREKDDPLVFVLGYILYPAISRFFFKVRFPDMVKSFYADPKCSGCGLCERVCLSGRIRMKDGKPEWIRSIDCIYCFACLHYCPVQAIQIRGRKTEVKGRYHHPTVKAMEIARQKVRMGKN